MVLWCKCGAFMGLREPVSDWSTDRSGVCIDCTNKQIVENLKNSHEDATDPSVQSSCTDVDAEKRPLAG